jgi:hypothetical protein
MPSASTSKSGAGAVPPGLRACDASHGAGGARPNRRIVEDVNGSLMSIYPTDHRVIAARNYLATAPPSDFTKLLADVVDVADDYAATEIDTGVSHVIDLDGAVYVAPGDVHRLPSDLIESLRPSSAQS